MQAPNEGDVPPRKEALETLKVSAWQRELESLSSKTCHIRKRLVSYCELPTDLSHYIQNTILETINFVMGPFSITSKKLGGIQFRNRGVPVS